MAIYLLGRLGDVGIADTLIEIISDEEEVLRPVYQQEFIRGTRYRVEGFRNEYFQFVSYCRCNTANKRFLDNR